MMSASEKRLPKSTAPNKKNLTDDVLHKVALFIVLSGFGVIMEDLTGIRKMYRKGKRPRIQIPGPHECVAILPTAKVQSTRQDGWDSR